MHTVLKIYILSNLL